MCVYLLSRLEIHVKIELRKNLPLWRDVEERCLKFKLLKIFRDFLDFEQVNAGIVPIIGDLTFRREGSAIP